MAELVCCGAWESKLLLLAWVSRQCQTDQAAFSTLSSTVPCQRLSSFKYVGGTDVMSDTMQQRDEQKGTWGGAKSPCRLSAQRDLCAHRRCWWPGRGFSVPQHCAAAFCSLCVPQTSVISGLMDESPQGSLDTLAAEKLPETKPLVLSSLWIELHAHLKWKPARLPEQIEDEAGKSESLLCFVRLSSLSLQG